MKKLIKLIVEIIYFPLMLLIIPFARLKKSRIDIGLGPEPLINNIYHKQALIKLGYSAETFVDCPYFIT